MSWGIHLGEEDGPIVTQVNRIIIRGLVFSNSFAYLRKIKVSMAPVDTGGVKLDLELGDLCPQQPRACCDEQG